jgi:hypothetical protein
MRQVDDALKSRFKSHNQEKYSDQIKQLEISIEKKQKDIEIKFLALQKEKEEVRNLERQGGLQKSSIDKKSQAIEKQTDKLQDKANAQEIDNEKPAGLIASLTK